MEGMVFRRRTSKFLMMGLNSAKVYLRKRYWEENLVFTLNVIIIQLQESMLLYRTKITQPEGVLNTL